MRFKVFGGFNTCKHVSGVDFLRLIYFWLEMKPLFLIFFFSCISIVWSVNVQFVGFFLAPLRRLSRSAIEGRRINVCYFQVYMEMFVCWCRQVGGSGEYKVQVHLPPQSSIANAGLILVVIGMSTNMLSFSLRLKNDVVKHHIRHPFGILTGLVCQFVIMPGVSVPIMHITYILNKKVYRNISLDYCIYEVSGWFSPLPPRPQTLKPTEWIAENRSCFNPDEFRLGPIIMVPLSCRRRDEPARNSQLSSNVWRNDRRSLSQLREWYVTITALMGKKSVFRH